MDTNINHAAVATAIYTPYIILCDKSVSEDIATVKTDRKNKVALGFRPLVIKPSMNDFVTLFCGTGTSDSFAWPCGRLFKAVIPIHARYAAAKYNNIFNNQGVVLIIRPIPIRE